MKGKILVATLTSLILAGCNYSTNQPSEGKIQKESIKTKDIIMNKKDFTATKNINMKKENFAYSFKSSKTPEDIFELLLDVEQWWSGLYEETIKGKSHKLNDEFSFKAGSGAHYSKQKLIELIPNKRIVWLVTDSKLNFLSDPSEWTNTKICFDISKEEDKTIVTFTHDGLTPQIECYNDCSGAWASYLENLKKKLK